MCAADRVQSNPDGCFTVVMQSMGFAPGTSCPKAMQKSSGYDDAALHPRAEYED